MKKVWNSIFQTVSQSVKTLSEGVTKKMRHDVVLMTTGISVVTMLTFTAGDLAGNGGTSMVAFAETPVQTVEAETELEETNLDELVADEEHIETEDILEDETVESVETEETAANEDDAETAEETEETAVEETETEAPETETEEAVEEEDAEVRGDVVLPQEEYQVLLRIVQAEAGICDEEGKLLVANVILNRMESEEFPDTVSGVVYQKKQFSPVMNGTINTCRVTTETIDAVKRALSGEDISEGALYFMNRGKSASRNVRWFDANLEYLFKHGDHEFFK